MAQAPGGGRHLSVRRVDRAGGRRLRPDPDADPGGARRRRLGDQRSQVVHQRRQPGRVHDLLRVDRAGGPGPPEVLVDHRADGHAGLRDRARRADDGHHVGPALRGALQRRPGAEGQPARRPRRGLCHCAEAAGAGSHLPLHEVAGAGPARLRADVRPRQVALGARFLPLGEGRDPALHRRVGGGDPGRPADDPGRRRGDGPR